MKASKIDKMSDKKVLKTIFELLQRATVSHKLIATDDGLITHEVAVIQCGDKFFASEPTELPWPLRPIEIPKEILN